MNQRRRESQAEGVGIAPSRLATSDVASSVARAWMTKQRSVCQAQTRVPSMLVARFAGIVERQAMRSHR